MRKIYLFSKTPTKHRDVTHIPIIKTLFLKPEIDFSKYSYLVVTSKQSVNALLKTYDHKSTPLICISKETASHAIKHDFSVERIGFGYGDNLQEILQENYSDQTLLYLRPEVIASNFASELGIDEAIVYHTVCNTQENLTIEENAILAFSSPSSVECFLQTHEFKKSHTIAVIGTTTQKAVKAKVLVANEPTVESLMTLCKNI
ncbi:MAG: uroporphyrinogen-III synthase [Helicobacteraceae bacterium]|nr:uroporphyrinogen-III synthase [Helicobacteraceae bacterium]